MSEKHVFSHDLNYALFPELGPWRIRLAQVLGSFGFLVINHNSLHAEYYEEK